MKIVNLTNPGQAPKDGDLLEYHKVNGVVRKHYHEPVLAEEDLLEYKKQEERGWRDAELAITDQIALIPDYPNKDAYLVYRQELRDYPSQPDFPNGTRPVKP